MAVNKFHNVWSTASCLQEFHSSSAAQIKDVNKQLAEQQYTGVENFAYVGLSFACAGLANGYRLLARQPASILQLTSTQGIDFVTLTATLQVHIDSALGNPYTTTDALPVAQGIAGSGLLPEFARVCSAVAHQLRQQQQQQQEKEGDVQPTAALGFHYLVNSLLRLWAQLQKWWPGKKLAGARGLAVTVQPVAELLVAIMQNTSTFSTADSSTWASSSNIRDSMMSMLQQISAAEVLRCMRHIMDSIRHEAGVSKATPEVQQLLSSTALQLLSGMSLGVLAQWRHTQRQGRSAIVESAVGQGSTSGGCTAPQQQQQQHLPVPPYHLLLWGALQCPVNTAAPPSSRFSDATATIVAYAASLVFECSANSAINHQPQQQLRQSHQTAPDAPSSAQQLAGCIGQQNGSGDMLPHDSCSRISCSSADKGCNSPSSMIAGSKVPYLQLMLVAAELQLLNPDPLNTCLVLSLMQQLVCKASRESAQDAAANPGTNSLHTQVVSAVVGPLGLGVRHACQLEASSAQGRSSSAAAAVAAGQQQQQGLGMFQLGLTYGKLLSLIIYSGFKPNWTVVLQQHPITSISNLELGLRAQAEASLTYVKQQTPAAASTQAKDPAQAAVADEDESAAGTATAKEASHLVRILPILYSAQCVAIVLARLLMSFQEEDSSGGSAENSAEDSAEDQEPDAAAVFDLKQPLAAVVALLSTLKVHKALTHSDGSQSMASDCVAHAAGVLSGLAGFNWQLDIDAGDNGNSHLWHACITLAACSFIAIGDGLARAIACDRVVGPGECVSAQPAEASTESDQAQAQKMCWHEMLQGVKEGLEWVYEQLLLLQQPLGECAASTAGDQAEAASTQPQCLVKKADQDENNMLNIMFSNVDQLYKAREQCDTIMKDLCEVLDSGQQATHAGGNCTAPISSLISLELPQQLQQLGIDLCAAVRVPYCCNNPGCCSFRGETEQQLVSGKGCVCAGCQVARYCGINCQTAHWPQHKAACKKLKKQRQKQGKCTDSGGP